MIRQYDEVIIKKTGKKGTVVEIDDDNGTRPAIYLVELADVPEDAPLFDALIWCGWDEIELLEKRKKNENV